MTPIFRAYGRDEQPGQGSLTRAPERRTHEHATRPALSSRRAGRERRRHNIDLLLFTVAWIAAWTAFAVLIPTNALAAG